MSAETLSERPGVAGADEKLRASRGCSGGARSSGTAGVGSMICRARGVACTGRASSERLLSGRAGSGAGCGSRASSPSMKR